jgi:hypothetical protein
MDRAWTCLRLQWLIAMLWLYILDDDMEREKEAGDSGYESIHHNQQLLPKAGSCKKIGIVSANVKGKRFKVNSSSFKGAATALSQKIIASPT